jgi:hypothetical protein
MVLSDFLSIGSFLVSIAGFLWLFFGVITEMKTKQEKDCGEIRTQIAREIGELRTHQAVSDTKIELFWKRVDDAVTDMLHQPIHLDKDALLAKWKSHTITNDEIHQLYQIIEEERRILPHDSPLMLGYALLLARIDTHFYEEREKDAYVIKYQPFGGNSLNTCPDSYNKPV